MYLAAYLRAEEVQIFADRYIASIALPDRRTMTTYGGICESFRSYFQNIFTWGSGLSPAHNDTYLSETAEHEGLITDICDALNL